jgi:hypothetical protein
MARRKNWSAEQIVATLRQIEVQIAQGKSIPRGTSGMSRTCGLTRMHSPEPS